MKTDSIEKWVEARYKNAVWMAASFAAMYAAYMTLRYSPVETMRENKALYIVIAAIALAGSVALFASVVRNRNLRRALKRDKALGEALHDEVNIHNYYRSYMWGYLSVMFIVVAGVLLTAFGVDISARLVCDILLLTGVLSVRLSWLIYNR